MQYLHIRSAGEIDIESFTLLGNSTKREKEGMIGRFGSGLKYSIARLLAMGVPFEVYSGEEQIEFSTKEKVFRDELFDVISINGVETNFTTQMGPDWEAYDCIREIYANAVDEELIEFNMTEEITPESGYTDFYIGVTNEVSRVTSNLDHYFSHFRNDDIQKIILNKESGDSLRIMPARGGTLRIYKEGFLVHENPDQRSIFHYDYSRAKINESRQLMSVRNTADSMFSVLLEDADHHLIELMMSRMQKDNFDSDLFESSADWWVFSTPNEKWKEFFDNKNVVTKESFSFYSDHVEQMEGVYVLPEKLAKRIRKVSNVKMYGSPDGDKVNNYIKSERSEMKSGKLEKAIKYLEESGIDIHYPIEVAEFEQRFILGTVDRETSSIIISQKAIDDRGYMEISEIILEEYFHLESEQADNTRGFQNYLIKQIVKYMGLYRKEKLKVQQIKEQQ